MSRAIYYYNQKSDFYELYSLYSPREIPIQIKDAIGKFYKQIAPLSNTGVYVHKKTKAVKAIVPLLGFAKSFIIYFSDLDLDTIHRKNGPAWVEFNTSRNVPIAARFFNNGIAHRENGPQEILFYACGSVRQEVYRKYGKIQRDGDKPSVISYWSFANPVVVQHESYYINGRWNRINDQPSTITYDSKGNVIMRCWHRDGEKHRLGGPAQIDYYLKSGRVKKRWIVNGNLLDRRIYPAFESGQPASKVKLTKASILDAMMFDREYGAYLQSIYEEQHGHLRID